MAFEDTANKRAIRRVWDRPILVRRHAAVGRGLYYFGLTGPEMHDIADWRDLLHRDVSAVEEIGTAFEDNLSRMMDVAAVLDSNVELLRGDIADVMTTGLSVDNEKPRRVSFERDGAPRFSYDLVNLDFDGGLGNVLGRHRAIEKLLKAQSQTPFTLLITYNVRHRLHAAISQELANLRTQIGDDGTGILDWYDVPGRPQAMRLKAVVPSVVSHAAATALLDCRAYPPVRYMGSRRTTLVHFAFDLTPRPEVFRAHHAGVRNLVTLPLLDASDGTLCVAADQDPGFDSERCARELGFLPAADRGTLLSRVAETVGKQHSKHTHP